MCTPDTVRASRSRPEPFKYGVPDEDERWIWDGFDFYERGKCDD
jgi:hypothetical protein